jgi:hypothetical protein
VVLTVNVEERPLSEIPANALPFLDYWRSIAPEGAIAPAWHDFDMLRVPAEYLPTAVVVDFNPSQHNYHYRYWGSGLTGIFQGDFTGKTFDDLPPPFSYISYQTYDPVVQRKRPCLIHFNISDGATETSFQDALRVPLSDDGIDVSGVISIIVQLYRKHEMDQLVESQMSEILAES